MKRPKKNLRFHPTRAYRRRAIIFLQPTKNANHITRAYRHRATNKKKAIIADSLLVVIQIFLQNYFPFLVISPTLSITQRKPIVAVD